MPNIDMLLLQNKNLLQRSPMVNSLASKFLLFRNALQISDLNFMTQYSNSYALISEKQSRHFTKIMQRLEKYFGTGPVGPNKYWEYPWVLANLRLEKGMSVLDAGCGKSPLQFLLSDVGCRVTGIDPFENVGWHGIDRGLARRFGCQIEYRVESAESISYANNSFDRVCCVSVIEHCREKNIDVEKITPQTKDDRELQRKMMKEMVRVLKVGGFLVLTVDFNIPRNNCLLQSNVDVENLISIEGTEIYGKRCPELFPGEKDFNFYELINNSDIDITNYYDTLQTSLGFVLQKKG
jgi:ubiquinone/menaquinone biosynthesis C-methylase UbiE